MQPETVTQAGEAGRELPWIIASADKIGLALLILMVVIVCWKAATRQAVGNADAFVGLLGVVAILLPLAGEISVEAFGIKLGGKFRDFKQEQTQANFEFDDDIAAIKQQIKIMEGALEELRKNQVVLSKFTAKAVPGSDAEKAIKTASAVSTPQTKPVSAFIFFRGDNAELAQQLEKKLLDAGYKATSRYSSLKEVAEQQEEGVARIVYRRGVSAQAREAVRKIVAGTEGIENEQIVVRGKPLPLRASDIQIQLF